MADGKTHTIGIAYFSKFGETSNNLEIYMDDLKVPKVSVQV
jgi:hypothetical protein